MGERTAIVLLLAAVVGLVASCTKQENSIIYTKEKFAPVTNLRAYSASGAAVSLAWEASVDANKSDYYGVRMTVVDANGNTIVPSFLMPKTVLDTTIVGLNEGTVYTFDFVSAVTPNSTNYDTSDHVAIQWAPASRFPIVPDSSIAVHEFVQAGSAFCGLQFFSIEGGLGPRVFRVDSFGGAQEKIDVFLRELPNSNGIIVLQSADLNPLLLAGATAKRTRFSTIEILTPSLNTPRSAPPAPSTYTLDKVVMGPSLVNTGKTFYAVTQDTNYVRIFVQRDTTSGALVADSPPNRRIALRLSYQTIPKVLFAKPVRGSNDESIHNN